MEIIRVEKDPLYTNHDYYRKIVTKIIFCSNKFCIDYGELPKKITVDLGTLTFLESFSGFKPNGNNTVAGYLMGQEVHCDSSRLFCDTFKELPELYFELSNNDHSKEYYINKDVSKEREKIINELLNGYGT